MNTATPTHRAERIGMLDTTRGIAVLGILLLNVVGFGLPEAYEDPTVWGGHEGADLVVWRINALFFEGTMRGLFTLLFGAGALLFLQRQSGRDADGPDALGNTLDSALGSEPGRRNTPGSTALYFRRTGLLILFGLFNAYLLLWEGDILFYYGVVGLFLYFFRKVRTSRLILIGIAVLTIPTILNSLEYVEYHDIRARAESALAAQTTTATLTDAQQDAIVELQQANDNHKAATADLESVVSAMRASYASAFHHLRPRIVYWETTFFIQYGFAECLGMMLLGMALLKLGLLSGGLSARTYLSLMVVGYTVGLAVNLREMYMLENTSFSVPAIVSAFVTYDLGRVPMTFGHLGLIGWLWQKPVLMTTKRVLARVGQMALTNYLMQSVFCTLLFTGAGFGLFGQLARHELYYVVLVLWVLQLIWSPWWLQRFQFGPAEWLWRSFTYGRRQPMRITASLTA